MLAQITVGVFFFTLLVIFFLPSLLAAARDISTEDKAIVFLVNLLTGMSGVGWLLALVLAILIPRR